MQKNNNLMQDASNCSQFKQIKQAMVHDANEVQTIIYICAFAWFQQKMSSNSETLSAYPHPWV